MTPNIIFHQKKSLVLAIFLLLFVGVSTYAQQDEQIAYNEYKGDVLDKDSKKPLVFATLTVKGTNISTVTNSEGEFALKVPKNIADAIVDVSFLGYKPRTIPLKEFKGKNSKIFMEVSVTVLSEVNISIPKDAKDLVKQALKLRADNYFDDPTLMTAFYRETIKKRKKNVSLSEAVVNIYKSPYTSYRKDAVQLYKARKSTDYSKLDTVALKLQGGPFNALYIDVMKYPEFIFSEEMLGKYMFTYSGSTIVNNKSVYIINFKQYPGIADQLYKGELYIDAKNKVLTSAIYSLNITNSELASRLFVRRKPSNAKVWPTEVAYRVDYREKGGKWYYGYSNVLLTFKVNWDKRLFNSVYSMTCEMAVTDWEKNIENNLPKAKERIKSTIILSDEAIGFSDPDFWGEYNIIEPEKSIESAIKKIQRQLKRTKSKSKAANP